VNEDQKRIVELSQALGIAYGALSTIKYCYADSDLSDRIETVLKMLHVVLHPPITLPLEKDK
jgi:hypothetical protein